MHGVPPLVPWRALLHPVWIASLVGLALNDHVLKGSELLPAWLTGKLSDVFGLVLAPTLLASVLGVRTRRGLVAAHLAVGCMFAAIQLSSPVAQTWASLIGLVGFPWTITMDPTDVWVALPALAFGGWLLVPTMRREIPGRLRCRLEQGLAAIGLLCCAASGTDDIQSGSEPEPDPDRDPVYTDVYVHNSRASALTIRVREPAEGVQVDCEQIADGPGVLLTDALFGEAKSWSVAPDAVHGLYREPGDDDPGCRAILFDADDVAPAILLWWLGHPGPRDVPAEGFRPGDPGGIDLEFDAEGRGRYGSGEELVFLLERPSTLQGACAPRSDGHRLAWTEAPEGYFTITALAAGLHGCWSLDLADIGAPEGANVRWHVCAPLDPFPFATGESVVVVPWFPDDRDAVTVRRHVLPEEAEAPQVELHLSRGTVGPEIDGLDIAIAAELPCGFAVDEVCGTVAANATVTIGGEGIETAQLPPDAGPATLTRGDGATVEVVVVHAQQRIALDPACAGGPDALGPDLEIVAVVTPPTP